MNHVRDDVRSLRALRAFAVREAAQTSPQRHEERGARTALNAFSPTKFRFMGSPLFLLNLLTGYEPRGAGPAVPAFWSAGAEFGGRRGERRRRFRSGAMCPLAKAVSRPLYPLATALQECMEGRRVHGKGRGRHTRGQGHRELGRGNRANQSLGWRRLRKSCNANKLR